MKKSISILMMAFVAVSLFSCSNQSNGTSEPTNKTEANASESLDSNNISVSVEKSEDVVSEPSIVGTWKGIKSDAQSKGTYTYIFNEDGTGTATFNSKGEEKVNENITMKLNMSGNMTFNWEKENSTIKINATNFKMKVTEKDISFKCKTPQEEAFYNSQKTEIINQINKANKDADKYLKHHSVDWKIKDLSNDKLVVDERGNVYEFTR